jgi:single-strand DNA-binding protein
MSEISIYGNVATEVELKFISAGSAVATFMVIASKSRKDAQGNWEDYDKVAWNVKCWRQLAENVTECIQKGYPVVVTGEVVEERWETKEGDKRSRMVLNAYHVGIDLSRTLAKRVEMQNRPASTTTRMSAPAARQDDPWAVASPSTTTDDDTPPF